VRRSAVTNPPGNAVPVPAEPERAASSEEPPRRPDGSGAVARQRWRLYVARPASDEPDVRPTGEGASWAAILAGAGLPLAGESSGRPRVVPAAPLPLGIAGEREVVDIFLTARQTGIEVRRAVADALPAGWRLVDLHDVWAGAPAAPAAVVAADYQVVVAGAARWAVEGAALALLGAESLPRERRREKRATSYDLRPLLLDLRVRSADGDGVTLAMRLRHRPDAVGRPEEVVAALAGPPAAPLPSVLLVRSVVRERLVLVGDEESPSGDEGSRRG
jgi:radical SAM-linked protein